MILYGDHYDIIGPLTPQIVPAWRRIQTTCSRYESYDYGIVNDVRVANLTIRGTEAEITSRYSVFVEPDLLYLTFEAGEYVFGTEVDYSGELSVESSGGAIMQSVNHDLFEITFEIKIKNAPLLADKTTSLLDSCVDLQFDTYDNNDIANEYSSNNSILNSNFGVYNPTSNIIVKGNFNEISKIKNWLIQDIRIDDSFQVPSGLFYDASNSAKIVNIQETIINDNDVTLSLELQSE